MRYRLRSLLILMAVMPPALAGLWFAGSPAWALAGLLLVTPVLLYFWIVI